MPAVMDADLDFGLPEAVMPLAVAMANEGIPVQAIARILNKPSANVFQALGEAKDKGDVFDVPRADWPPMQRRSDRIPSHYSKIRDEDFQFVLTQRYALSKLECRFLVTLLRNERASKEKLHGVIEQLRNARATRPDAEQTDPKMVDVIICKLRKRIKVVDDDVKIMTEWGVGYYMTSVARSFLFAKVNAELGYDPAAVPVGAPSSGVASAGH